MELLDSTIVCRSVEERERFFEDLYEKAFPPFARYAGKMNASFEDARDVFHDALVIYYEKTLDASFSVDRSPKAYVLGIARHLWLRKFNREQKHIRLTDDQLSHSLADDDQPHIHEQRLLKFLEKAGQKCMELLSAFYFGNRSLKEIAAAYHYRTEHSVAVQKYKCIGKLRDAVKAKSLRYEDLNY